MAGTSGPRPTPKLSRYSTYAAKCGNVLHGRDNAANSMGEAQYHWVVYSRGIVGHSKASVKFSGVTLR